eukprot:14789700-Alexandrium_andersonii.AAC.1
MMQRLQPVPTDHDGDPALPHHRKAKVSSVQNITRDHVLVFKDILQNGERELRYVFMNDAGFAQKQSLSHPEDCHEERLAT